MMHGQTNIKLLFRNYYLFPPWSSPPGEWSTSSVWIKITAIPNTFLLSFLYVYFNVKHGHFSFISIWVWSGLVCSGLDAQYKTWSSKPILISTEREQAEGDNKIIKFLTQLLEKFLQMQKLSSNKYLKIPFFRITTVSLAVYFEQNIKSYWLITWRRFF